MSSLKSPPQSFTWTNWCRASNDTGCCGLRSRPGQPISLHRNLCYDPAGPNLEATRQSMERRSVPNFERSDSATLLFRQGFPGLTELIRERGILGTGLHEMVQVKHSGRPTVILLTE